MIVAINPLLRSLVVVLALCVAPIDTGAAQPGPIATEQSGADQKADAASIDPVTDPLGRDTPRGLVAGLMAALGDRDFARAARFLETDAEADRAVFLEWDGRRLARQLQEILDRSGSITSPVNLSGEPGGRQDDGLPPDTEVFGSIRTESGATDLLARRVERTGSTVWLVSRETLGQLPLLDLAADDPIASIPALDRLPAGPPIMGVPTTHWLVLIAFGALSYGLAWAATWLRRSAVRLVRGKTGPNRLSRFVEASEPPLRLFLAAIIFSLGVGHLGVSVVARYQLIWIVELAGWLAAAWLLWRMTDAVAGATLDRMSRRGQLTAYSTVSFASRVGKGLIAAFFFVFSLRALGVDVTAGLAALGIGGLAIALGAQKLFENLIGSMTLIADRPVRVGDFCRFGDTLGTIEEIGIRSTRVRTLDRTVVTVPNGEFSSLQLENYSRRDRFWFHHTLGLRYETSPDQIRFLLQELRSVLYAHPKVDPDPARVRFVTFNAYSLDIEIFAYVYAVDYNDFLEIQEDLMLRCMDVVARSGTGFAFPSQTLYLGRDQGLNGQKTTHAESIVRKWTDDGELQIPRFRQDRIDELRRSIDYPPRGAAVNGR
ncbi:MAG: mechanosensitive ion channel family protein [Inquilinaceae bacterium]